MGKIWSTYEPAAWANHSYHRLGFRAVTINGIRGYVDQGGSFESMDMPIQSEYWLALKKVETEATVNSISAAVDRAFNPGDIEKLKQAMEDGHHDCFDPDRIKQEPEGEQVHGMLKQAYLSATWKDRHAKGVPVKMTFQEFSECADTGFVYPIVRDFNEGNPIARVERQGRDETVASFCDFRYKPEWLEKRSVGNSDTPRDFDSPPIGGVVFKD